jgi:hypothetical protein
MAEDSGAFKTNPRNSAQFGHFIKARPVRGAARHFIQKTLSKYFRHLRRRFVTSAGNPLRYSRII